MAINAYTGLMGSGKSFEVVSSVILPAVKQGRRVVTNIDGINPEAIYEYLITVKKANPDKLGQVVGVTNEDVNAVGFFPDETKPEQPSIVRAGDLVAVDECWQFWGTEHKISDEHMRFFRMHRHYTHPDTGVSCDLALMIQDLGTLNRKIRAVIEMTSRTVKLKSLGAPKAYRIELYEGNKTTQKSKIDTFNKFYDKAIFPLYKSYAAGNGTEKSIDKRQNIFTNPRLWVMLIGGMVLAVFVGWKIYHFFNPAPLKKAPSAQSPTSPVTAMPGSTPVTPEYSTNLRYAGTFQAAGETWAVIVDSNGRARVESPSVFTGKGVAAVGKVEGKKVTAFSGATPSSAFVPMPAAPQSVPVTQGNTK